MTAPVKTRPEAKEIARLAAEAASEKQASDILVLDIRRVTLLADYFVICSAQTERQLETVVAEVEEQLGRAGVQLLGREGTADSGWAVLDFGDVIVHVFRPQERAYYRLEEVWAEGTPVVRII
ncbi:MAG: ribosome silencing factor [Chloroflexota bacterium]